MTIDTFRGMFNIYPVSYGRWQASAGWAVPGESAGGSAVWDYPHFAASPAMSRRRCKAWAKKLGREIRKGGGASP